MTAPQLESVIASLAARIAGAGTPQDPAASFASLGLDSLGTIELSAELERITGLDVAPEAVAECKNARALARRLRRCSRGRARLQADSVAQMIADAALPADIRPSDARGFATLRSQAGLRHANTVLLTGATGFLGRWIVRELLETSPARLLCIVRPSRTEGASSRLEKALARAGCSADAIRKRVCFVEADLELPRLGLDRDRVEAIAEEADAVCHAGASVNWVQSYSALRDVNVLGTLDLLRLACLRSAPFHFISSASVCYSTAAPREADEHYAPLGQELSNASEREARAYLHGLHLGYAQTKAVAESLVREAGRRGLPVKIYRSALISGHSAHDDFNGEDLLTLLVRGCVRMGDAPDLDWTLDALPVDAAARWIADLSASAGTFHLRHPRPRHWRECVLWMRVYGYPVRLIPYAQWIHQLERELEHAREDAVKHPLYPLRRFLIERPQGADGWTRPQLYEDVRRTRLSNSTTMSMLARTGSECVELDGALLEHYVEAFQSHASLPSPPGRRSRRREPDDAARRPSSRFDEAFFTRILGRRVVNAVPLSRGSEHSIVSELTAWRARKPIGLFTYRLQIADGTDTPTRDVVLKIKARDLDVTAVGDALASVCDRRLGDAVIRWRNRLGFAHSHHREIEVYRQTDVRIRRHVPHLLGSVLDDESQLWALALERVEDATHANGASDVASWDEAAVRAAIEGLASVQAVWYGREGDLRRCDWIGFERTASAFSEMIDLWAALAEHARASFVGWTDPSIVAIQRRLIAAINYWAAGLDGAPRTLIHNDFNPRNLCLRRTPHGPLLCVYDWELATIGAPQRDLAELLCFVCTPSITRTTVEARIELHRQLLELQTGCEIDRTLWLAGFKSSLYEMLVDRLSMYALINRVRRQAFLPRVLRTWVHLYRMFPLDEAS